MRMGRSEPGGLERPPVAQPVLAPERPRARHPAPPPRAGRGPRTGRRRDGEGALARRRGRGPRRGDRRDHAGRGEHPARVGPRHRWRRAVSGARARRRELEHPGRRGAGRAAHRQRGAERHPRRARAGAHGRAGAGLTRGPQASKFAQPTPGQAVGDAMLLDGKRLLITGVLTDDSIAYAVAERAQGGGAVVGLDFDATRAWPTYDWMGVAKAALEAVNRYLARDLGALGVRANLVAAGPLSTIAARGIDGFDGLAGAWERQAPLGWDTRDAAPVADACLFLLSDLARAVTGEVLHVDGGYHALGAPLSSGGRE